MSLNAAVDSSQKRPWSSEDDRDAEETVSKRIRRQQTAKNDDSILGENNDNTIEASSIIARTDRVNLSCPQTYFPISVLGNVMEYLSDRRTYNRLATETNREVHAWSKNTAAPWGTHTLATSDSLLGAYEVQFSADSQSIYWCEGIECEPKESLETCIQFQSWNARHGPSKPIVLERDLGFTADDMLCAFSSDSHKLAIYSKESIAVRIYDMRQGKGRKFAPIEVRPPDLSTDCSVEKVTFTPDGSKLLVRYFDEPNDVYPLCIYEINKEGDLREDPEIIFQHSGSELFSSDKFLLWQSYATNGLYLWEFAGGLGNVTEFGFLGDFHIQHLQPHPFLPNRFAFISEELENTADQDELCLTQRVGILQLSTTINASLDTRYSMELLEMKTTVAPETTAYDSTIPRIEWLPGGEHVVVTDTNRGALKMFQLKDCAHGLGSLTEASSGSLTGSMAFRLMEKSNRFIQKQILESPDMTVEGFRLAPNGHTMLVRMTEGDQGDESSKVMMALVSV